MLFIATMCTIMSIFYFNPKSDCFLKGNALGRTTLQNDLGAVIPNNLKFLNECNEVKKNVQRILRHIKRLFSNRKKGYVVCLLNFFIRLHLDYATQFRCHSYSKDVTELKKMQASATKPVPYATNKS